MEAEFNSLDICEVSKDTVSKLKEKAASSPRGRYRLCLHHDTDRLINEMIIVGNKDTYIRPHRHPTGRDESYHVLEGEMIVFFFDDSGQVLKQFEMGDYNSGKTTLYRLSASIWHLPVPLSDTVVYHEVFTGPFNKDRDVEYAPWSPDESEKDRVKIFMNELMRSAGKNNG